MGSGADHQSAGRRRTVRNPLRDPRRGDVVVFLHAHPDDESIFTGGTIAQLAEARGRDRARDHDDDGGARAAERPASCAPKLRRRRAARGRAAGGAAACACAAIGVDASPRGPRRRRALHRTAAYVRRPRWASDALALACYSRELPRSIVKRVDATSGCTGHPDHLACHAKSASAASPRRSCANDDCLVRCRAHRTTRCHGARRAAARSSAELAAVDTIAVRRRKARRRRLSLQPGGRRGRRLERGSPSMRPENRSVPPARPLGPHRRRGTSATPWVPAERLRRHAGRRSRRTAVRPADLPAGPPM